MPIKSNAADRWFDVLNYGFLTLLMLIVLYPLYVIVISSVSDPNSVNAGQVWLLPKGLTFEGYERIFQDERIWTGYRNSLLYTTLGTCINVVLTLTAGYALSRNLVGRGGFMFLIVFTMFFGGGLIPSYLLIKELGMYNTIWSQVIPTAVGAWNIIMTRTFFQMTIPNELQEAAEMDGCSDAKFFWKIVLPLSTPIIAVMVLFSAVGHWNSYFQALIYLREEALQPLQIVLREILIVNETQENTLTIAQSDSETLRIVDVMKYGIIIVACLPMLVLYPFLQRYFVKGVMIGSIKG
ncbi:carbohydrate ABC transporter permease [Paenibacillus alkaliterrae]|uniref:carbohydrate ABC transporter permease n=1 Tax=Paenibacillus alkaliterrae TaxID=320909 RepID=UPI001F2DC75D|nr:carbohydrate ABC transporter permease [Paenibacillus alkaliterrae]MCF2941077.1 carbohydrate ABC transporter permease [Paenibacillus alkaliterrae]